MEEATSKTEHQQQELIEILREDYARFPQDQTYDIYADQVYFKDPLNEFRGVKRYQAMISFLASFFKDIEMEVHNLVQEETLIKTEWTLNMTPPLPWKPRLSIPGWSELIINEQNLIASHVDYWRISPWQVLSQNFTWGKKASQ
ncbi:MAG: DUF2358 domain-containing protein [Cyanobacteria bacterium P01_G01_bin.39]